MEIFGCIRISLFYNDGLATDKGVTVQGDADWSLLATEERLRSSIRVISSPAIDTSMSPQTSFSTCGPVVA